MMAPQNDFETLFGSANNSVADGSPVATVVTVRPRMVTPEMRETLNYLVSTNPPNMMFTADVTTASPAAPVNEVRVEY